MPDPNWNEHDPPDDNGGVKPPGTTVQPTNGAPAGAPAEPTNGQGEGVQQVKHSDFKRIKEEQRAKGRREAIDELDAKARTAGFESHDDALKALAALKKPPTPPPTQTPIQPRGAPPMTTKPTTKTVVTAPKDEDRLRAENVRATDDRSKMRKQWRVETRKRRELEAQLQAKDAEIGLREECYRAGVKDVDYVIRLLTRELQGKTQEEITKFDRNAFYESTRKDKPYLFGETVVAATTGTGGETTKKIDGTVQPSANGAPAAPAPGAAAVVEAEKKQFDARTAKPAEVQQRLRELGLNPHL